MKKDGSQFRLDLDEVKDNADIDVTHMRPLRAATVPRNTLPRELMRPNWEPKIAVTPRQAALVP